MTTTQTDDGDHSNTAGQTIKRRGLFSLAWAAVAAFVLRQTAQPVEAGVDGDVVLGSTNMTAGITKIINTTSNSWGLQTSCTGGPLGLGLFAVGGFRGVLGENTGTGQPGGAGVFGYSQRADSYGVVGQNILAQGVGVLGESADGTGVLGRIPTMSPGNGIGVYGLNSSTYAGPSPGAGGFGVYGLSAKGPGLVGATAAAGAAAVVGATNGVAGAYAAAFYGPVIVGGTFTVVGGAKSAAVPHPDGSHRRVYCLETPESWFEDFGTAHLECGRADISIDPDFGAVADLTAYHVFLTEYEDNQSLYVTRRSPNGFSVQARSESGDGSGSFSWRVVAKRKDIPGVRFDPVTIPSEPTLPPPVPERPIPTPGELCERARTR
jgi:hypothetical protein